jgi:Fe-Mn family superoxide dismutase
MVAVDAWEHAYFADYQTAKAKYVDAVLSGLDWNVLNKRFAQVGHHK